MKLFQVNSDSLLSTHNDPTSAELRSQLDSAFSASFIDSYQSDLKAAALELQKITESTAYAALLNSAQQLSAQTGVSLQEAMLEMIKTFRKLDRLWGQYLHQEAIESLKN